MLQEDIIKALTTENGINKNILNEITISKEEFFDRCSCCAIVARGRAFEIQDENEREKTLAIIKKNEDMIFMLEIFTCISNASRKNESSIRKELAYGKKFTSFIVHKQKCYKLLYLLISLSIAILAMYIKNNIGFIPEFFVSCFIVLLLSIAYLYKKSSKKIDINIKTFNLLCKIEEEILD